MTKKKNKKWDEAKWAKKGLIEKIKFYYHKALQFIKDLF